MEHLIAMTALLAFTLPTSATEHEEAANQAITRLLDCYERQAIQSLSESRSKEIFLSIADQVCGQEENLVMTVMLQEMRAQGLSRDDTKNAAAEMINDIKTATANLYQDMLGRKSRK